MCLALAVPACAHAPKSPPNDAAGDVDLASFVKAIDFLRTEARIPGLSMAVVRDGRVVLATGFGVTDLEKQTPATAETLYPIGSITKTFTSTLMLQLVEQGRLDLEQPVARYVTWEVAPDIRIRHVLSHTSGGTPGSRYAYSSRFNWLDDVVSAATGEPFPALLKRFVLEPAGLGRTLPGLEAGQAEDLAGLARPYRRDAEGHVVLSKYPPMALHSSSGLTSTVLDLATYSAAFDDGRLLNAQSLGQAFAPARSTRGEALPYGLGWFTQEVSGLRIVWHGSWWPDAYSGLLLKVPERKLTLVLLANADALSAPQAGASNVLLSPFAIAFLRQVMFAGTPDARHREVTAMDLVSRAGLARWQREPRRADDLLRQALACCGTDVLRSLTDDDRLLMFGDSGDLQVRQVGIDAALRVLAAFPDDTDTMFNLALLQGLVRREYRVQGPQAADAVALLERILALSSPLPKWMNGWSSYLVAEHIAESDPVRARRLAERARASGADTDGLQARVGRLLERLP